MRGAVFHPLALALVLAVAPGVSTAAPTTVLVQGRILRGATLPGLLVTPGGELLLTNQLRIAAAATAWRDGDVVAISLDASRVTGATAGPPTSMVAVPASAGVDEVRVFDPQARTFSLPIAGAAWRPSRLDAPGTYAVISTPAAAAGANARLSSLPHPCSGPLADPTSTATATAPATATSPAHATVTPTPSRRPATPTAAATRTPSLGRSATPTRPPSTPRTSALIAFATPSAAALAFSPGSVVVADFNHDGRPDLAIAAAAAAQIDLRLGEGANGFSAGGSLTLADAMGSLTHITAGDLDGDGDADLVAADPAGNQLLAAIGNGEGDIAAGPAAALAASPNRIALHDLTADGLLDALATAGNGVALLVNTGDAMLELVRVVRSGQPPADIALIEATGDDWLDLVVASSTGLVIHPGDGAGDFADGRDLSASAARAVAVADFTGDGRADLAAVGDTAVAIYPGAAPGLARPPLTTPLTGGDQLIPADLNGDGLVDLLVSNDGGARSAPAGLGEPNSAAVVLQGSGDGRFAHVASIAGAGAALAVADLDGDHLPEVIVAAAAQAAVFIAANTTDTVVIPGDLDTDGRISDRDGTLLVAEIFDGDGTAAISSGGGQLPSGAAADANRDGSIGAADLGALQQLR